MANKDLREENKLLQLDIKAKKEILRKLKQKNGQPKDDEDQSPLVSDELQELMPPVTPRPGAD
jgi:hypothetical protein